MARPKKDTSTKKDTSKIRPFPVPNLVCDETVKYLEELLAQAKKGELVGVVGLELYKGNIYDFNIAGEAQGNLLATLGMIERLNRWVHILVDEAED